MTAFKRTIAALKKQFSETAPELERQFLENEVRLAKRWFAFCVTHHRTNDVQTAFAKLEETETKYLRFLETMPC